MSLASLLRQARANTLALTSIVTASCGGAASVTAQTPNTPSVPLAIEHQACDTDSKSAIKIDSNGDGKADIIRVMSDGKEVCREVDLNHDGRPDRYVYLDASGAMIRREADFDRDGKIDEIAEYVGGVVVRTSRETNLDDKLDTWDYYENGKLVRRLRDTDGNGTVDQWWTWPHPDKPDCPTIASDRNGDGQPEASDTVDTCADPSALATAAASATAPSASATAPSAPASATAPSASASPAAPSGKKVP